MKNIKFCIVLLITLLGFSCSLEETIYDLATPESAIKSVSDVDNAIIGAYASINAIDFFGRSAMWVTHSSADDLSSTAGNEPGVLARRITLNSSHYHYIHLWWEIYEGISNSNGVLDYVEQLDLPESFENKAVSEAKFLRGFFYFNLVNLYGGVPLILKSVDASQEFNVSRNSVDEVYTQIFLDLEDAIAYLPSRSAQPSGEKGRATKQSAQAYMVKACLHYANYLDLNGRSSESGQYYQKAIQYADEILNSGEYQLVSDYATLWDVNQETVSAREILFAVINTRDAANPGNQGEGGFMVQFFNPNTITGVSGRPDGGGTSHYKVQPWFIDRYLQGEYVGDYRVEKTFRFSWTNWRTGKNRTTWPNTPTEEWESQPYIKKYVDAGGLATFSNENDFYLIRLSDIYLMKAEAENELNGPTAAAYTAFNKVRERARLADGTSRATPADLTPGLSKEDFRMKIFDERGLEFIGEYSRYFDLRRMRYKDNTRTMLEYQFDEYLPGLPQGLPKWVDGAWTTGLTEATNIAPYNIKYELIPIPSTEIAINPNLVQNPGW
ncbi:Starch-binding associating with outer membrane [Mariniphaga anaerophila]|uniref:Starch-binding associating with outer membrane n=1 Tax=Mariniphaga anaerophila TaxID=1484053 RepID=A0A1M4UCF6_9BACT|nr:RagB/SusD family nutrient uptake outer membrane protein [Mariniphaga anaerophila]SHE54336.1 Starch-binding associating with outer membrane [Mariniphaga anaerophila]